MTSSNGSPVRDWIEWSGGSVAPVFAPGATLQWKDRDGLVYKVFADELHWDDNIIAYRVAPQVSVETTAEEACVPAVQVEEVAGHSEVWEVGQHPAVSNGWIVRPALFGSRVRVLPEHEGGHVLIRSEKDARLIAAGPCLLQVLTKVVAEHGWRGGPDDALLPADEQPFPIDEAMRAISRATGATQ